MGLKENIKKKRLEKDLTLEALAKQVGVSRQTIQRYESGAIGNIPSDKIELIAKALNVSPAELMGWDTANTESNEQPQTIAAHFDGDEYTEEELEKIKEFARFVKSTRK